MADADVPALFTVIVFLAFAVVSVTAILERLGVIHR